MGNPPMGWAPAVFGRFLKPGGRGGRPTMLALPTIPLVEGERASRRARILARGELGLLGPAAKARRWRPRSLGYTLSMRNTTRTR